MDPDVVDFDPGWAIQFDDERSILRSAFGSVLVTDVEHVGSTSVPGLAAKPIIDMIAGVASLDAVTRAQAALSARGYGYRKHRPEAHLFVRVDPLSGFDTHHLHLTVPGSALWVERLAFRDALRGNRDLAGRYAAWKREHATGDPRGAYDTVKTPFVAEILAAYGIELTSDHRGATPA